MGQKKAYWLQQHGATGWAWQTVPVRWGWPQKLTGVGQEEGKERGHREVAWALDMRGKMERLSKWMRLITANIKGKDLVERRQLTSRREEISEKVGGVAERLAGGGSGGCSLEE